MVMYGYRMALPLPPSNATIAGRVQAAMKAAGLSEVALADQAGIPRSTLRRRFLGNTDWLTGELAALSAVLGVRLLDLLADEAAA